MNKLILSSVVIGLFMAAQSPLQAQTISTIAGCGLGDDSVATHAEFVGPVGIAFDTAGNAYICESGSSHVRKVSALGMVSTVAGNGSPGHSGDGGQATDAAIGQPYSSPIDKYGNMYIIDPSNSYIRKVTPAGIISTIAGTGTPGYSGDGGPSTAAQLQNPTDGVVDSAGNLIFADFGNNVVRKISPAGIITTIVGDGSTATYGDGGPASASELGRPFRVTMDKKGNLYVAEVIYQCICKVDTGGIIHVIGGTGTYAIGADGDGGQATAATMTSPCGLAVDTSGNLYFSDIGNDRVRKINMNTGIISNYAAHSPAGYSGDGGAATVAQISTPEGLGCDAAGNVYICDADNNRVRMVNHSGIIGTFAGWNALYGEGYSATNSELGIPVNITTDAAGNIYIVDFFNNRIRKVDATTGQMTTVAGSGIAGYDDAFSGDGGAATLAHIYNPSGVAVDNTGTLFIVDQGNQRVRKVNTSGIITTIAGDGTAGYSNDNVPGTRSELNYPGGIAVDDSGNVYVADLENNRIRKINSAGIISTFAGVGAPGYSGDGGVATDALLMYPNDVATDGNGNVYFSDAGNNVIRKVDTAGNITTVAGDISGTAGFAGDGGPATASQLSNIAGVKVLSNGDVLIADAGNQRVREVNSLGIINTIVGNGTAGFSGDGGPALSAMLNGPAGVALDGSGNLFIADGYNYRIRKTTLNHLSTPTIAKPFLAATVYPNPTMGMVTISNVKDCDVILYDVTGQEIFSTKPASTTATVDLEHLPAGVYIFQTTNADGTRQNVSVVKK